MNTELMEALTILEKEKNISRDTMMDAIENSLISACKNHFGTSDNIKVIMNRETCDYAVYAEKEVVEEVFDPAIEITLEDAEEIDSALQIGDVDKVVPVDKSSAILSILLAFLFLHESISPLKLLCVLLIGAGTYLMITKKETSSENSGKKGWSWFFYALGSAVFASLTSILGKVGIENIDSNLGTAIRTIVVLIMAWIVVFVTKKQDSVRTIDHRELGFICLSGLATGASWLCYYRALQDGLASVVVPIDKLSILVTILFSYLVFHEKLGKKEAGGLVLIVVGTLGMLV